MSDSDDDQELTATEVEHLGDNPFDYISYVSLREVWTEIKEGFGTWFAFMVLAVVVSLMVWGAGKLFGGMTSGISMPTLSGAAWFTIIYCAATWFARGETIHFRIPKYKFGTWFIATFCMMAGFQVVMLIADWLVIVYFYTLLPLFSVIDKLNVKGYLKYRSMRQTAQPLGETA